MQRSDLTLSRRIHEHRTAVFVLLCGTSGTGKSTLASLLVRTRAASQQHAVHGSTTQAARMGISTVISTDFVRGVVRSVATAPFRAL